MNLVAPFWKNADRDPSRPALIVGRRQVSYDMLRGVADRVATRLDERGLVRGDRVTCSSRNVLVYVTTILASARLGAICTPSPHDASTAPEDLPTDDVEGLTFEVLHADEVTGRPSLADRTLVAEELFAPAAGGRPDPPPMVEGLGSKPWMHILSSGTTGQAKRVAITHDLGAARAQVRYGLAPTDRVMVHVGAGVTGGLMPVMSALLAGGTAIMADGLHPAEALESLRGHAPHHLFLSTGHATQLIAWMQGKGLHGGMVCPRLRSLHVAGSPVSPALARKLQQGFGASSVHIHYGSTETGPLTLRRLTTDALQEGDVGRPHPWVRVEAVGTDGTPLPRGVTGLLRFRSHLAAAEYVADDGASQLAFRDGWVYLGDRGRVMEDGSVRIDGREDDVITIGGLKIDPNRVETVLNALGGVHESCVLQIRLPNRLLAYAAAVVADRDVEIAAVKAHLARHLHPHEVPGSIFKVDALARNEGGKILRRETAALIEERFGEVRPAPRAA